MKKLLFVLIILCLCSTLLSKAIDFSYVQGKKTRTFSFNLNSDTMKYLMVLKEQENGRFSLKAPPVFTYKKDNLTLGEIRIKDFTLIDSSTVSLNPQYSGISYQKGKIRFAISNSFFSPTSDNASFFSYEGKTFKTAFLITDKKNKNNISYQTDWLNSLDEGFSITNKTELNSFYSQTAIYNSFNSKTGSKTELETNFYLRNFVYSLHINTKTSYDFSYTFGDKIRCSLNYHKELGKSPIYGGTSQSVLIKLRTTFSFDNLLFGQTSINDYSENTGMTAKTEYFIRYRLENISLYFSSSYVRTNLTKHHFKDTKMHIIADNLSLIYSKGKVKLNISKTFDFNNIKTIVSINQNREISIYAHINYD